jgi:hypothetical protein
MVREESPECVLAATKKTKEQSEYQEENIENDFIIKVKMDDNEEEENREIKEKEEQLDTTIQIKRKISEKDKKLPYTVREESPESSVISEKERKRAV